MTTSFLIAIWLFLFYGLRNVTPMFSLFFRVSTGIFFFCMMTTLYLFYNEPHALCSYMGHGSFSYDHVRGAYIAESFLSCPIPL